MNLPHSIIAAASAAVMAMLAAVADQMGIGRGSGLPIEADAASEIPPITARRVETFALNGATDTEIADRFLIDETALRKRYANVLRSSRAYRHISIRSYQSEAAKKGQATVLTWLGRNELGQSNSPTIPGDREPEIDGISAG